MNCEIVTYLLGFTHATVYPCGHRLSFLFHLLKTCAPVNVTPPLSIAIFQPAGSFCNDIHIAIFHLVLQSSVNCKIMSCLLVMLMFKVAVDDPILRHIDCVAVSMHTCYFHSCMCSSTMSKRVKVNADQQLWSLLNTLSASHITVLIALKQLCQLQLT